MALKLKSIRDKKPEAMVLVGLPGCGKSTWAWEFKGGYPVVSVDAYIERMACEEGLSYAEGYDKFYKLAFAEFRQEIDQYRAEKKPFIWDHLNVTRAERELIYRMLAPTHSITYVCFLVPVEECLRRAEGRAQNGGAAVNEPRIRKLARIAEFPSERSGERYDRIVRLTHPDWNRKIVRA